MYAFLGTATMCAVSMFLAKHTWTVTMCAVGMFLNDGVKGIGPVGDHALLLMIVSQKVADHIKCRVLWILTKDVEELSAEVELELPSILDERKVSIGVMFQFFFDGEEVCRINGGVW